MIASTARVDLTVTRRRVPIATALHSEHVGGAAPYSRRSGDHTVPLNAGEQIDRRRFGIVGSVGSGSDRSIIWPASFVPLSARWNHSALASKWFGRERHQHAGRSAESRMQSARANCEDRLRANNVANQESALKRRTTTIVSRCVSGGFAVPVMCAGTLRIRRAAQFPFESKAFTGQKGERHAAANA